MDSMNLATPKSKMEKGQNIKVFVRVRPLNSNERQERAVSVVHTPGTREVGVRDKSFTFDKVFGVESTQPDVYKSVVSPLVHQVLQGYNCTVFAYGQTGTGKTHTMEGPPDDAFADGKVPEEQLGIIPRAINDIFDNLRIGDAVESFVRVSFVELYNEELFDLLSGFNDHTKLRLYDDPNKKGSVIIKDLSDIHVKKKNEVYDILRKGSEKRRTAETKMNAHSSRSHTIFTVTVYMRERSIDGDEFYKIGKLNLVDLAGSENIGRSGAAEKQAREAGNINQSLLTLGRVITSLVAGGAQHVPYRESKLTRLLQDSLGGRTKTSIIATVSPASSNVDLTLSTLDYAQRAKKITNKPEVNLKISNKEKIMEYQSKIDRLQAELQAVRDKDGAVFLPQEMYEEQTKKLESQEEEIKTITKEIKALETERDELVDSMSNLKTQLSLKETKLGETERMLSCVKSVLYKTENEKREQVYLVERHIETECKLRKQAELLLAVSDEATRDREKLHDKLDRKRFVETTNEVTANSYRQDFTSQASKLSGLVGSHVDQQKNFCSKLNINLAENLERRSDEKGLITNTYTEAVTKLIETASEIERIASGNMYKEQAWVEKLLKRVRNEADVQSQSFHMFLVEQLLAMHTDVLASVNNLRKTVKELSAKTDKTLEQRGKGVDSYLSEAEKLQKSDSDFQIEFFSKMGLRNSQIEESAKHDELATQEYVKKSAAIVNQFKGLLTALVDTEQKYLSETKQSRTQILEKTSLNNEDLTSARVARSEKETKFFAARDKLKTELESEHAKFGAEKSSAVELLMSTTNKVTDSVDKLREQSESFVNRGKDAWNLHYAETETSLRQKSDDASQHVTELQGKTQQVKVIARDSQSTLEGLVESSRIADERDVQLHRSDLSSKCSEVTDFGSTMNDELRQVDHGLGKFLSEDLRRDLPTGQTPSRVQTDFPRKLIDGTPDDERVKRFRQHRSVTDLIPPKLDIDDIDDDGDSVISASTNMTEERRSGSRPISRQNSGGSFKKSGSVSNVSESEGYPSDKENLPSTFNKPKSKLKPPAVFTRDRSGSRTRLGSKNSLDVQ